MTKITASDGAADDFFAGRFSVAISGDTAIVGADRDDDNGLGSGSAYVYQRNEGGVDNWGQVTKITASDGAAGEFFGSSVTISGATAIVGAIFGEGSVPGSGSAYVYQQDEGGATIGVRSPRSPPMTGRLMTGSALPSPSAATRRLWGLGLTTTTG